MDVAPEDCDPDWVYRTVTSAVVPRPIAWVSTTSPDGVDNLAPFSFFNAVSADPPMLAFAPQARPERPEGLTDTARYVRQSGEFVVNTVDYFLGSAMNETSATLAPTESEFDHADVERAPAAVVTPPLVADAPVAFECTLEEDLRVGNGRLIVGEVVHVHVDNSVLTDGDVDIEKVDLLGRLSGSMYADIRHRLELQRPE